MVGQRLTTKDSQRRRGVSGPSDVTHTREAASGRFGTRQIEPSTFALGDMSVDAGDLRKRESHGWGVGVVGDTLALSVPVGRRRWLGGLACGNGLPTKRSCELHAQGGPGGDTVPAAQYLFRLGPLLAGSGHVRRGP